MNPRVVVAGGFDDLGSRQVRFLEEAARLGELTVLLWSDGLVQRFEGKSPKFPESERRYVLESIRYVDKVYLVGEQEDENRLPALSDLPKSALWVVPESRDNTAKGTFAHAHGFGYHVLRDQDLAGFPEPSGDTKAWHALSRSDGCKKVIVTGCYDWFHSGHVRFFEEVSAYGDLYVVVGHDANIRLLKGEGHPLLPQEERRYVVGSVRFVRQALVSTGEGWLDAEPEIRRLKPDIYAVNEDGDRGGKREYCAQHGIEYLVLMRTPAPGLPARSSTDLRGF